MTKITLIGCTSQKKDHECKAVEMYSPSKYFQLRLKYAQLINSDHIYILSAKYGLLNLNDKIKPYNLNLNKTNKNYQRKWSLNILKKLNEKHDLKKDTFILLAGEVYRRYLEKNIKNTINPVPHKRIGYQQEFYKKEISRLSKWKE